MRVQIDEERCRGHGMCQSSCPKVFDIGGGGYAVVRLAEIPAELHDAVRVAAIQCPERAILVTEQAANVSASS